MKKYANYIIFFLFLSIIIMLKDTIHVSTNLLSLFADKNAIEKLNIADKLGYSKELLIAVKGFDKTSKSKVLQLSKELEKLDNVLMVNYSVKPSVEIREYYKKYYPILSEYDAKKITTKEIKDKLETIYNELFSSAFYLPVDKNDPLKVFKLKLTNHKVSQKDGFMSIANYGYLIRVSTDISPSNMDDAKSMYDDIHNLLASYDGVVSFAPFYYTVENSSKIKDDVSLIVILSTIILLLVYYMLIKNIKLLLHTLIALSTSMLGAFLISTLVYDNFSALSLAFGMSISAVSIDYLLHYYFHNFYKSKEIVDKNVLYGYLTTVVAFGVFTFIDIPIISQISFFAVVSLSISYLLFSFIFAYLEISDYEEEQSKELRTYKIPSYIISIFSIALIVYSGINMKLDDNIKNLDYQNVKLLNLQNLFLKANNSNLTPILVSAISKDKLLENLHILRKNTKNSFSLANFVVNESLCKERKKEIQKFDFDSLNKEINSIATSVGFRKNYFHDAYKFTKDLPPCKVKNLNIFKQYSLSIIKNRSLFYTIALVDDAKITNRYSFLSSISAKEIFANVAKKMYKDLLFYSLLVFSIIMVLLLLSVRKKFLYAFNYIIFPISVVLAVLTTYVNINIMHIFSLIILIAIGIDYGIYMSNTTQRTTTILAIKYSILSTFAAFGVLVFSSIVALNSIGIVISVGASAIFLLIRLMK